MTLGSRANPSVARKGGNSLPRRHITIVVMRDWPAVIVGSARGGDDSMGRYRTAGPSLARGMTKRTAGNFVKRGSAMRENVPTREADLVWKGPGCGAGSSPLLVTAVTSFRPITADAGSRAAAAPGAGLHRMRCSYYFAT